MSESGRKNTDNEIWRERHDDYYADSIHITKGGEIGINCGGLVIVKTMREWHSLGRSSPADDLLRKAMKALVDKLDEVHDSREYMTVFEVHQRYNGRYAGPRYAKELTDAKAALSAPSAPDPRLVELVRAARQAKQHAIGSFSERLFIALAPFKDIPNE